MALPVGWLDTEMRVAVTPASDGQVRVASDLPAYEPAPCETCARRRTCVTECGRFQRFVATGRDPGPGFGATRRGPRLTPGALEKRRRAGIPEHLVALSMREIAAQLGLREANVQKAVSDGRRLKV